MSRPQGPAREWDVSGTLGKRSANRPTSCNQEPPRCCWMRTGPTAGGPPGSACASVRAGPAGRSGGQVASASLTERDWGSTARSRSSRPSYRACRNAAGRNILANSPFITRAHPCGPSDKPSRSAAQTRRAMSDLADPSSRSRSCTNVIERGAAAIARRRLGGSSALGGRERRFWRVGLRQGRRPSCRGHVARAPSLFSLKARNQTHMALATQ